MPKHKIIVLVVAFAVIVAAIIFFIANPTSNIKYVPPVGVIRPPLHGSSTATVTVEEFSDFQCPACKSAQAVVTDISHTFGDKIKFTFRHFPLISVHTQAFRAALAAECANDQGKFWEYHDKLFAEQPNFSRDELVGYAKDLGLNTEGESGFVACLDSRFYTETIRADMGEGNQRGLSGTPTFYVNGQAVPDWNQLKQAIQSQLMGG